MSGLFLFLPYTPYTCCLLMHYHPAILSDAVSYLQKYFDLGNTNNLEQEALYRQLARKVQYLLQTDLSRLLHILYRIDVEERLVKQAMQASSEREISEELAHLIIEREVQKAWTRSIYRHN